MSIELEESFNNNYLIKNQLANLRKYPGYPYFNLDIGNFSVRMYANAHYSEPANKELPLLSYKKVSILIVECIGKEAKPIYLSKDYRFAFFWKDNCYTNNNFDWENGNLVPIELLYKLIVYIQRINELILFH